MNIHKRIIIFSLMNFIVFLSISNSYAEVQSIETDNTFYIKGESVLVTGNVESDDTGLVSIVIRDPNDEFVLLVQTLPDFDNRYEIAIDTETKFLVEGQYNVTGFILNMTEGAKTEFEFFNEKPIHQGKSIENNENATEQKSSSNKSKEEPPREKDQQSNVTKIPGFPDPSKDPKYYVDRYNNEPKYKDWFDRNFPQSNIYEIVGIDDPNNEVKSEVTEKKETVTEQGIENQTDFIKDNIVNSTDINDSDTNEQQITASFSSSSNGNEVANLLLAIGGLGILFGAVYGIKRKTDNNSEQIFQNRSWIKNQINNLAKHDNPKNIIKKRVAKGEITIEEFYSIKDALEDEE